MIWALLLAQALPGDPRIETLAWHENRVLRLTGRAGLQAVIMLSPDEHIENVAIGDANSWQVTPNQRATMLFVKPLAAHARTNLTVVTDRHTYFLDLVAGPHERPIYGLRVTVPAPPAPPAAHEAAAPALTAEETALAHGAPDAAPVDPAALDTAFAVHGAHELTPLRVFSDGKATYLAWPKGTALPAVLAPGPKGSVGPINYAMRDDMIVIPGVPATIVLRSGKASATITHTPGGGPQR